MSFLVELLAAAEELTSGGVSGQDGRLESSPST